MRSTVGWRDWASVVVSTLLALTGLLAPPGKQDSAIVVSVMFGFAGIVGASRIVRKFRERRLAQVETVSVPGEVPIRQSPLRIVLFGAGLLVLGVVILVYDHEMPRWLHWTGWVMAVPAALMLAGVVTGFMPREYLMFRANGLVFAHRRWQVLVPWESIQNVQAGEYGRNPALFLWLDSPANCVVTPPGKQKAFAKMVRQSRNWIGCDVFLITTFYGIDLPVFFAAIERYRNDSAARRELTVSAITS